MADGIENEDGGNEEIIQEARNLGWVPQDEFKGNPDSWVDANEFVERGKHLMPILRQNNRRLQQDLLTRDREINTLKANLENAQKAIDRLDAHYTEATKRAVAKAKIELREQIKQAREDNDVDAEFELQEKLDELKYSEKQAATAATTEKTAVTTTDLSPEFIAWNQENPWYGDVSTPENKKKTKEMLRIVEDLLEEGETAKGRALFDKGVKILNERFKDSAEDSTPNRGKVEGGAGGRSGARSTGSGFASLPREARDACHADAELLVGKGKKYATLKEWEADYARIYNAE